MTGKSFPLGVLVGWVVTVAAIDALAQPSAKQILDATGVKGGLVVHLGCGDGKLTAEFCANDSYLVHGLDADARNVALARNHIRSLGLYGKVSVAQLAGNRLPYVDNLANLVVADQLDGVTMDEVLRVLVPNDTLYATAGRSSYLDGGIVLYRLNPATGEELSRTILYHLDPQTGRQLVPEANFNMEGTTSDLLSGDGDSVFLKYFTFDRDGKRTDVTKPHLFSFTGFLGEEWFVRNYWMIGQGMPGAGYSNWQNAANAFPFGRILCFNNDSLYGYGRAKVVGWRTGHRAEDYRLFGMDQPPAATQSDRKKGSGKPEPKWSVTNSLIVRAMALGNDRLAVAGPPDLGQKDPDLLAFKNEAEARAGFEGLKGVCLRIVRAPDGQTLSECSLPAMPVFDGLSAADGRLYIATMDGRILCYGGSK